MLHADLEALIADNAATLEAEVSTHWGALALDVVRLRARLVQEKLIQLAPADRVAALLRELRETAEELEAWRGGSRLGEVCERYAQRLRLLESQLAQAFERMSARAREAEPPTPESRPPFRFLAYLRKIAKNLQRDEWRARRAEELRRCADVLRAGPNPSQLGQLLAPEVSQPLDGAFTAYESNLDLAEDVLERLYARRRALIFAPPKERRRTQDALAPLGMARPFLEQLTRLLSAIGQRPEVQAALLGIDAAQMGTFRSARARAYRDVPGLQAVEKTLVRVRELWKRELWSWRPDGQRFVGVFALLARRTQASTCTPSLLAATIRVIAPQVQLPANLDDRCEQLLVNRRDGLARLVYRLVRLPDDGPSWLARFLIGDPTLERDLGDLPDPIEIELFLAAMEDTRRELSAFDPGPAATDRGEDLQS